MYLTDYQEYSLQDVITQLEPELFKKVIGLNVDLYSTVILREDYNAMAGQLADFMRADVPHEDYLPMVAKSKATYGTKIAGNFKSGIGGTYRPSYIPPIPVSVKKKSIIQVDTNKVHAGKIVMHKAFDIGEVKGIDGSRIVVSFKGTDKTFQFPGAFEQGFLLLDEE